MSNESAASSGNESNETVVVAEDSAPNRAILVLLLKKLGFHVIECVNGAEAWNQLTESETNGKKIVAVVSDLMMPELTGLGLLKKCRESEKWKSIPFVLVTAVSDKDYVFEAKSLGVNGYVLKPVTYKRIMAKMGELFPNKKFREDVA